MTDKATKRQYDRNYIKRKQEQGFVFKRVCLHTSYQDALAKTIKARNREIELENAVKAINAEKLLNRRTNEDFI